MNLSPETQDAAELPEPAAGTHDDSFPDVGEIVAFHARPGERRQGRDRFPAIVLDNRGGYLHLLIFFEADDQISLRNIPPMAVGGTYGWSRPGAGDSPGAKELTLRIGEAVFGPNPLPDMPIIDQITELRERLTEMEQKWAAYMRDPTSMQAKPKAGKRR